MNQPPRGDEHLLWSALVSGEWPRDAGPRLGIPPNRVRYLCEKWSRQGRYEWGTSVDLGWVVKERMHED